MVSFYGNGSKGIYREKTIPVGSFDAANAFGLSDMHGNVWEWCLDRYHYNYKGAPTDGSAWIEKNSFRMLRGGSWSNPPETCRSAYRNLNPDFDYNGFGLRIACSIAPELASPTLIQPLTSGIKELVQHGGNKATI
ncbi:MAG: formylglycine-generating enzyme family protein [Richelia sp. RM2_1_2]|nr:formylglycine-generating enzyme family protein [Richelia sp. RM2_1_2]